MKHLIICLDGTWSDADAPAPQTNIAILADIIDPRPAGGPEQRVYYDAGVGTGGVIDRIAGGLFGKGLSANVLAAYRFLSHFYRPGDNIYVFGFSRGAFTARSLCGFLSASGLLTQDMCNEANQEFAWGYYRTPPKRAFRPIARGCGASPIPTCACVPRRVRHGRRARHPQELHEPASAGAPSSSTTRT